MMLKISSLTRTQQQRRLLYSFSFVRQSLELSEPSAAKKSTPHEPLLPEQEFIKRTITSSLLTKKRYQSQTKISELELGQSLDSKVAHRGESQLSSALNASNTLYAWEIYCGMAKSKELDMVTADEYKMLIVQMAKSRVLKPDEIAFELGRLYDNMLTLKMRIPIGVYLALLKAYSKVGQLERFYGVYSQMDTRKLKSWFSVYGSLITAYALNGRVDQIDLIINEIKSKELKRTEAFNCKLLHAYILVKDKQRALDTWKELLPGIEKWGSDTDKKDISAICNAGCALAKFLSSSDILKTIYFRLSKVNISGASGMYTLLLSAAADVGDKDLALVVWNQFKRQRMFIDNAILAPLIKSAFSAGDVTQALSYFEYKPHPKFVPRSLMYEALISGYAKSGDLESAMAAMGKALSCRQAVFTSVYVDIAEAMGPNPEPSALFERHGMVFSSRHAVKLLEAYVTKNINIPRSLELIIKCLEAQQAAHGGVLQESSRITYGVLLKGYAAVNDVKMVEKVLKDVLEPIGGMRAAHYVSWMRVCGMQAQLQQVLNIYNRHFEIPRPDSDDQPTSFLRKQIFVLKNAADAYTIIFDTFSLVTVADSQAINEDSIAQLEKIVSNVEKFGCTGVVSLIDAKVSWEKVVPFHLLHSCRRAKSIIEQYRQDPQAKIKVDTDNLFQIPPRH